MPDQPEYLSEEEASRLWRRAAQLQAEDARAAEARAVREAAEQLDEPSAPEGGGYALTHVRSAALEAGIGAEFVEAALADLRAEQAAPVRSGGPAGRLARRILGGPEDAVSVRRVIRAAPAQVLSAMEAVLPTGPYNLSFRDQRGDPLAGGVLVFDILGASFTGAGAGGFAGDASWADFRQVLVTLREVSDDPPGTEVTVRAPISWAFGVNAGFCGLFTVMGGGLGMGLGSAGGAGIAALAAALGLAGTLPGVLVALAVTGGLVAGGAGGRKLYRTLYGYSIRKGRTGLEGLLSAVAARAQGGWGILPGSSPPPSGPPGSTEDG